MELIRVENLFKTYFLGEVDVPVLKGISLSINKGEMVALMGTSGSGKSTLMNILGLLDRPTSGKYWLNGQEVSRISADRRATVRNRNIGFVFQSFNLLPRSSAVDQVRMPLVYSTKPCSNREGRRRSIALLERVGLAQRLDHEPSQLSGGQQQRVAISRALINQPPILLADEPTGNLDSRTSEEILQMFQRLNREEGITVVLVTHDLHVARHADRIIYVRDGLIDDEALNKLMHGDTGKINPRRPLGHVAGGLGESIGGKQNHAHVGHEAVRGPNYQHALSEAAEADFQQGDHDGHEEIGAASETAFAQRGIAEALVAREAAKSAGGLPVIAARSKLAIGRSMLPTAADAAVISTTEPTESPARAIAVALSSIGPQIASAPKQIAHGATFRLTPRTLTTAVAAIRRNAFRSVLTTLGIVMGIAAVIAMMEIGQGSATAIEREIAAMGANRLLVLPGSVSNGGVRQGSGSVVTLKPEDCDAIMRDCPSVSAVAPFVGTRTQVVAGNRNWVPNYIGGTTPAYFQIRNWTDMSDGSCFTDRDVERAEAVCVLGQTVATNLFGDDSPVGKDVRINGVAFRVLGVLSPKGANMYGSDQDDLILAPWTTIKFRVSSIGAHVTNQSAIVSAASGTNTDASTTISNTANEEYPNVGPTPNVYPTAAVTETTDTPQPVRFLNVDQIMIQADSADDIPTAMQEITDLLHDRHHIGADESDDFQVRDLTEMTKTWVTQSATMKWLLLAVAAISLMVGGVGIMNIMLVSVTERTREIGLRMAVGARPRDILRQFIFEAVILCLFGGAVGIMLGRGASLAVRSLLHWPTEISVPAIIAAVAVSVTVGLVFGYYPAWKASRFDPIEALRYE